MALLMPITSPRRLTSGPPEFPGLIAAPDPGPELTTVGEDHLHAVGALDDVVVGEDVAVPRDDEAGARLLLVARLRIVELEELLEAGRELRALLLAGLRRDAAPVALGVNCDHGRRHAPGHGG